MISPQKEAEVPAAPSGVSVTIARGSSRALDGKGHDCELDTAPDLATVFLERLYS